VLKLRMMFPCVHRIHKRWVHKALTVCVFPPRRVRVSLGLKPLKAESDDRKKKEQEADAARRADAAKAARAAELKDRVDR